MIAIARTLYVVVITLCVFHDSLTQYITDDTVTTEEEPTTFSATGIRLVGGVYRWEGRVEIYHNGQWGTICDDGFDRQEAQVICFMLGYSRYGNVLAYQSARFGEGYGPIMLDDLACNGYETDVAKCSSNGWFSNNCGHVEDASVSCQYPRSTELTTQDTLTTFQQFWQVSYGQTGVRLVGGYYRWEGRVELYHNGEWGTICDDSFDRQDAQVICAMLGYNRYGSITAYQSARFGSGSGRIMLDDLSCHGYESDISQCQSQGWYHNNCNHNEDASVSCQYPKSYGDLTTEEPMTTSHYGLQVSRGQITPIRLIGGVYSWEGSVLVFHNGRWGTICDDNFDREDAQVICAMLGYNRYGSVTAYSNARFGEGNGPILIDELRCNGYERDISECLSNSWYSNDCKHNEDAGVSCQYPKSEEVTTDYPSEVTTSGYMLGSYYGHIPIRLTNGSYGLLEVYYRGRWGYVCHDHYIPTFSMNRVCRYLGYKNSDYVSSYYESGPAILSHLSCDSYSYYYNNGIDYCRGVDLGYNNYCSNKLYIYCEDLTTEVPMTTPFTGGCQSAVYNPADVVFVVDESGSVGSYNFERTKQSIVDTIRQLDIRNDNVRLGLINFDDSYHDVFYLSSYIRQPLDMERSVMQMKYSGGGTDIGNALYHACHVLFQQSYGDRPNAQNYIVLLTDGQSSAQYAADDCKARGIKIITVGIGDGIDELALRNISYTSNYYVSINYTDIARFLPRVVTTAVNCGGLEKTDERNINVNCQHSNWNIQIHLPPLEQKYSGFNDGDVYLGQHSCTGHRSGDYLLFDEDYTTCGTTKETSQHGLVIYKNTLIYAVHDPYQPYIVHEYRFKINVECDMSKMGGQVNYNQGVTVPWVAGTGIFPVNLKFYSDKDYLHELIGFPPSHMVGQNIYVNAQTPIHDYDVKMRLSDCYTKPSKYASDSYTYYLIRNGCPSEPNAYVTSTRTHETKFHFQDFEYAFQPDSMYIHCNATFCHVNDYSLACEPRCHTKRVAEDEPENTSGIPEDDQQGEGPIGYAEDEAVINIQYGAQAEADTGERSHAEYKHGKPLYVVGAVVTGVAMLAILVGVSLYFRSKRNRQGEIKTI